tara:strand:+ start:219 stop:1160 length:942 start_codon:yes stop_codon:yes gene_type:complete
MNKALIFLSLLFVTQLTKAQMGSQDMSQLRGIENATINVILYDDDCKKCHSEAAANASLRKAVDSFFKVSPNINYIKLTKENRKELKDDDTEKYFLEMHTKQVVHEQKSGNIVRKSYTYLHYLYLTKRKYKIGIVKMMKNGILAGYRLGETPFNFDPDVYDLYPFAVKVLNAYLEDAMEYKTLKPEIIANNNWRKKRVEKVQIFRGYTGKKGKNVEDITAAIKAPVEFLGFNEILQKIYTQDPEENAIFITPNKDISSGKDSRGTFYYYLDLATGKMYFKQEIKGIKFKYFGKKDLEKMALTINGKYSTKRKK